MADVLDGMNGEDEASPKCREARRKRIEMRRLLAAAGETPASGSGSKKDSEISYTVTPSKRSREPESDPPPNPPPPPPPPPPSGGGGGSGREDDEPGSDSVAIFASDPVPDPPLAFGFVALSGRSREMEDAVSLRPDFCVTAGGSPLHFFAVFDGHGGSHVSMLCTDMMHMLLAEELTRAPPAEGEEGMERLTLAVKASFTRMDEMALISCACGRVSDHSCGCERSGFKSDIVGSTAVVAVVGPTQVLVANCGDSRAVLSRGGRAVPLSDDHKVATCLHRLSSI